MGKIIGLNCLVADVDEFLVNSPGIAGKQHALKSPIWKKYELFVRGRVVREHIPENVFDHQIRFYPAKLTGKQAISFFQSSRCPALGALVFDLKIDGLAPRQEVF
jgi:hypothetical protein